MKITKKISKEFICEKLRTDTLWIKKALLLIYSKQTLSEQISKDTTEDNGVGFTGCDSKFLSSIALQLKRQVEYSVNSGLKEDEALRSVSLSDKQYEALKKSMPKYWGQVLNSCEEEKLEALIHISYGINNNWKSPKKKDMVHA
jgi:hypothetical protein